MDVLHMKSNGTYYEDDEEVDYNHVFATTLVAVDTGMRCVTATSVELKAGTADPELANEHPVKLFVEWLNQLCHRKIRLRTDGEPLLVHVAGADSEAAT